MQSDEMAVQFDDSTKETTAENRSDMPASHRNFGNLLEEGIKRVHITRKKPIGYILDEFGYELRPDDSSKGRYALGHWYYKKRIPASIEDVTRLATLIVTNSDVDRDWLKAFLDSAGYPESDKFCDQFFLSAPSETAIPGDLPVENTPPTQINVEAQPEITNPVKPKQLWLVYALGTLVLLVILTLGWNQWVAMKTSVTASPVPSFTVQPALPDPPTKQATREPAVTQIAILPSISPTLHLVTLDGNCPGVKPVPAFKYDSSSSFRDFLNSGGSFNALKEGVNTLIEKKSDLVDGQIASPDLNKDGVPEVIVSVNLENGSIWQILGCDGGQYQAIVALQQPERRYLRFAVDLNGNQFPEIISYRQTQMDSVPMIEFLVQEWGNGQVLDLMDFTRFDEVGRRLPSDIANWQLTLPNATGTTTDTNGDGLYELVITGGLTASAPNCETRFERKFTETWAWNGKSLQLADRVYNPAVYRFQRAADGDLAFALNQMDRALDAYQDVLFEANLFERDQYIPQLAYCSELGSLVDPALTENEWDQLAAYARWRILLINALKGAPDAMQVVYQTLQEKFPEGKPGHAYAVIASAFWENYQTTRNLQVACLAANSAAQSQTLHLSHKAENICYIP